MGVLICKCGVATVCVPEHVECVPAGVLDVLDILTDLANLWSVECVGSSNCILDGYSRELIHASACVGFVQYLPCFVPVYCPS